MGARARWRAGIPAVALVVLAGAAAGAERHGIEGHFRGYDPEREVFRIEVESRSAGGIGGSAAGGRAPDDVKPGEIMEFAVPPEGSVLSRTVIKSSEGTGLAREGTREAFRAAVEAIPRDRPVALSIVPNAAAGDSAAAPAYRIRTVIIRLTEAEIRERLEEVTADE